MEDNINSNQMKEEEQNNITEVYSHHEFEVVDPIPMSHLDKLSAEVSSDVAASLLKEDIPIINKYPIQNFHIEKDVSESKEEGDSIIKASDSFIEIIDDKSFSNEIRGLLNNYPKEIDLKNTFNLIDLAINFLTIRNLLIYCKVKTTKYNYREKILEEIRAFESIDIILLEKLLVEFSSPKVVSYGKYKSIEKIEKLINPKIDLVISKVQFFYNCLPIKGRQNFHLRTSMGLPPLSGAEYESEQIAEGEKVKEGGAFRIDETGQIVPIDS